ncbi:hypothetical protein ESCO_002847 [Escovopsis weberi]|uniref:MARVEL domain-containing protein n=1 Tax=Escovopsis weberi TaxID=150374 RepID=A0A0M8MT86_ESCWE|nr:hypothetical protein ESCO_002847 [Escovopsis weberi]
MVQATRSMLSGSSSVTYEYSSLHRNRRERAGPSGKAAPSHVRTYNWPSLQLNLWMFVMLLASTGIMGVFAGFVQIQHQMRLHVPWYFPYYITISALVILFIICIVALILQRRLLPAIVVMGAFILFILWLVGLVAVGIEMWGPGGSVMATCDLVVFGQNPKGPSITVLAWLEQRTICQSWQFVFAMGLIGSVFLFWIMIMAYQVFARSGPDGR